MRLKPLNNRKITGILNLFIILLILPMPVSAGRFPEVNTASRQTSQMTFMVNSSADGTDALPGDGVCETAQGNGVCTLRAAVQETNALSGPDTIQLPAGTFTLTIAPVPPNDDATGDLDVIDDLTLNGAGSTVTIIDAAAINDRIIHLDAGVTFEISEVTLQHGGNVNSGAGIFNQFVGGVLIVRDSILRDNHTLTNGGAIDNFGGTLVVENSLFENNVTEPQVNTNGGAIFNNGGTATITDSTFQNNQAGYFGGAISNWGDLTLSDSRVENNTTDLSLSSKGGGIYNAAGSQFVIDRTTISGNRAIFGGGISNESTLGNVLQNSLLSGNQVFSFGLGGGVHNLGSLLADNITISGNHSDGNAGGIFNRGNTILSNATLVLNTANNNGAGIYARAEISITTYITLENSILANNTLGVGTVSNCATNAITATISLDDYNLVDDASGCSLTGGNNQVGVDPLLGALSDNGGPTWTHALPSNSPAIDAGDPAGCMGGSGALLTTDQRGLPRPVDGNGDNNAICDVGAYEYISTDLVIAKTDNSLTAVPGTMITYTLTVTNEGFAPAPGVLISDTYPAQLSGVSWICSGSNGAVCQSSGGAGDVQALVDMAPGSTATIQAGALIDPAATGAITNWAGVQPPLGILDPNPGNNLASDVDTLTPEADLRLSLSDAPDPIQPNGSLVYTLHTANDGPSQATSLTVTDTLPAGITYQSALGTGWTCGQSSGTVTCTRPDLPPGNAPDINITLLAPANTGTILDRARISSNTYDPDLANNFDQESTTVTFISDMQITHKVSTTHVLAGYPFTLTLNVYNGGPSNTTGVVVTDTLPAGVQFLAASGSGWTCNMAGGQVNCNLPVLAVGTAPEIQISLLAPQVSGVLTNAASVASAEIDLLPGNNTSSAMIVVDPVSDLAVTGATQPSHPIAGQQFIYTLTVVNAGPNEAANTQLVDQLPPEVQFVSAAGAGWSCSHASGTVTCDRSSLAVGPASPVQVSVVAPSSPATITNRISVTSDSFDPNLDDNLEVSSVQVVVVSNLEATFLPILLH